MKKIISAVLTVSMLLGASSVAYAQPRERASTSATIKVDTNTGATQKKVEVKKADNKVSNQKAEVKKNSALDKLKEALVKKCDEMIAQINKLKGYIISSDGKFLVEFKDQASGDAAVKSINDAIAKVEAFKTRINAATMNQELKAISKELQNNWMKHQTVMKRITGLTSTARLKTAYDETKALVDKLGAGINGITITTGSSIVLDLEGLKKDHQEIVADLEEARADYLEAVAMFSSITDSSKAEKTFKAAQEKLMDAKDELHDVLSAAKKLLVKIKTSVHKQLDATIKADDDDDDDKAVTDNDEDDDDDDHDEEDD